MDSLLFSHWTHESRPGTLAVDTICCDLKDRTHMPSITRTVSPRWATIRGEVRHARAVRAERKSLERDLASYTSEADLNDLDAILDRHSDEETRDIRRILAGRRLG
jgi:hypothetical protein